MSEEHRNHSCESGVRRVQAPIRVVIRSTPVGLLIVAADTSAQTLLKARIGLGVAPVVTRPERVFVPDLVSENICYAY